MTRRSDRLDDLCVAAVLAAAITVYAIAAWAIAGTLGAASFPLDDSWIHLHFARNLAEGAGFSYNPGQPVAGSTAPLWTLVLAAAFALAGAVPEWAKVLGIASALGTALLTRRLVSRWTESRMLALGGGALAALAGPLVWGALSGMEVALAALLVTGGLLCHTLGRDALAALLLGSAVLARPESLLLVPLVWLARPVTISRSAMFAVIVGLCLAPWIAFNLATAGTPLPATASAKVEGGLVGALSGATDTLMTALVGRPWQFEREWIAWLLSVDVLLPVLMLPGLWGLWRRDGRGLGMPALVLLLHPIGMALLAPYRGPGFQEGRYSIHLLPLAIAVAAVGIRTLTPAPRAAGAAGASAALSSSIDRWRRRARPGLTVALIVGALSAFPDAALRYAWAVQNIDAMQVHLGHWIAEHTPPGARIALNDVGAIAYVSRREVVDVMGLVTPAIIPYRRDGEAGVLRYLERVRPDYLAIFPSWFPELAAMTDRFRPIYRLRLDNNTVAGGPEMVVYTTPWTGAGGR